MVRLHRLPGVDEVAAPGHRHQFAADDLGQLGAVLVGDDLVVVAVDDEHRTLNVAVGGNCVFSAHEIGGFVGCDQHLAVGLQCPPDRIVGQLGRMRFGDASADEEVHEIRIVTQPVKLVVFGPALGGFEFRAPFVLRPLGQRQLRVHRAETGGRTEHDQSQYPIRVTSRQVQRVVATE